MSFRIRGLEPALFASLVRMDDDALRDLGVHRFTADEPGSAPCRISLRDAAPGESLLLLSFEHQPAASPFRASGPIFVREAADRRFECVDRIPDAPAARTISARAYDGQAMMVEGELVPGADLAALLDDWFRRPEVDVVHLHYARRGCYAALAERA